MADWEVFVRSPQGQIITCHVPPDCQAGTLLSRVRAQLGDPPGELRLMIGGRTVGQGPNASCISLYGAHNRCSAFVLVPLRGGVWPTLAAMQRNCRTVIRALKPLPGFITITYEADMITLDDDPNVTRARMPCGHVLDSYSMTEYCQSLLSEQKYKFTCPEPRCNAEWPWFVVRHVACLTETETELFETKCAQNFLMGTPDYKQCPGCAAWCKPRNKEEKVVRCPLCTNSKGNAFDFCWRCLKLWGDTDCANRICKDPHLVKALKACGTKKINGVICPDTRACPKCGILIHHTVECKHMTCGIGSCKHGFCFICLKPWGNCGGWSSSCTPAPIQE